MQDSGVVIKNSLQKHTLFYDLMEGIITRLKNQIKQIEKLKLDPELTLLVCNLIENSIPNKNKYNIDKKDLALQVFSQIFGLSDEDKNIITQQIDFLYNNDKIKKVKFLMNAKNFLSALLVKKFL